MAARARVLVFDGPKQALAPLTLWLLERGFAVHRGDRAEQALAALGASPFELVVVDAMLPDGVELARAVRSGPATRHLAVVLVTDDEPSTAAAQALAAAPMTSSIPRRTSTSSWPDSTSWPGWR